MSCHNSAVRPTRQLGPPSVDAVIINLIRKLINCPLKPVETRTHTRRRAHTRSHTSEQSEEGATVHAACGRSVNAAAAAAAAAAPAAVTADAAAAAALKDRCKSGETFLCAKTRHLHTWTRRWWRRGLLWGRSRATDASCVYSRGGEFLEIEWDGLRARSHGYLNKARKRYIYEFGYDFFYYLVFGQLRADAWTCICRHHGRNQLWGHWGLTEAISSHKI